MVEMSVAGIALDAASRTPMVLLRDPSGRRQVPIWIDQAQAHNIINHVGIPKLEVRLHGRLWLVKDEWRSLPVAPSERVVVVGGGRRRNETKARRRVW